MKTYIKKIKLYSSGVAKKINPTNDSVTWVTIIIVLLSITLQLFNVLVLGC